jgi:pantoate--beta-alanine ligase
MRVVRTKAEVREWVRGAREAGDRIALVPTMGALHAGHLSLVELAKRHAGRTALSIFVNPLQFGPAEDLDRYPRDLDRDLALAGEAGVDLVFAPSTREMYPGGEPATVVVPERGADVLDGASRPGHFRGVLTVVAKLFGIFAPDVAVFGEKDYQQLTLIRRMVLDLDYPITVVGGPIVREPDGLAMSSRNRYLTDEERVRARSLSRALARCRAIFASGERMAAPFREALREAEGPGVEVEYAEVVDPDTLTPLERIGDRAVCAVAARVGATRLIDNTILES